ncbi:hypothetical protein ACVWY2_002706 [Bradyrhizobium sp. JR6.1]
MTLEEMKAKAGQIQKDIDAIIDGIDASEIKDAVNWADLSCTDVSVSLTDGTWCATVEDGVSGCNKSSRLYSQGTTALRTRRLGAVRVVDA